MNFAALQISEYINSLKDLRGIHKIIKHTADTDDPGEELREKIEDFHEEITQNYNQETENMVVMNQAVAELRTGNDDLSQLLKGKQKFLLNCNFWKLFKFSQI